MYRNAATDRIAAASKKSDEHRNSHVLQELNRSDDTPTLTLPNADGTFRGKKTLIKLKMVKPSTHFIYVFG